jgi:DNA-binding beta-propeller fold protein YncE
MVVFDREGNFLRSWGEGVFPRAHGITMGPGETIYCTDDEDHTVRRCTLNGRVLLTLGASGKPAPFMSGKPFNRCTHVAISPVSNEFYVSDGYGNARVHKYTPGGRLLFSWGEPGTEPGQFNIVHNICCDKDGYVYVADRENHRVQVFDAQGRFETQWVNMSRPCGLFIDNKPDQLCYIGELGAAISANDRAPGLGPRVSIYTLDGKVHARLGDIGPGEEPGRFIAPHGIGVDSRGDIYVAEVSWTNTGQHLKPPRELRSLQKLVKVG